MAAVQDILLCIGRDLVVFASLILQFNGKILTWALNQQSIMNSIVFHNLNKRNFNLEKDCLHSYADSSKNHPAYQDNSVHMGKIVEKITPPTEIPSAHR